MPKRAMWTFMVLVTSSDVVIDRIHKMLQTEGFQFGEGAELDMLLTRHSRPNANNSLGLSAKHTPNPYMYRVYITVLDNYPRTNPKREGLITELTAYARGIEYATANERNLKASYSHKVVDDAWSAVREWNERSIA